MSKIKLNLDDLAAKPTALGRKAKKSHSETAVAENGVRKIHHNELVAWKHANRPESEYGDLAELGRSLTEKQLQNIGVRELAKPKGKVKYEVFYGRRRWLAARAHDISLDCLVVPASTTDAECFAMQHTENSQTEDVSIWAQIVSYDQALKAGVYKNQAALASSLNIDRKTLNRNMVFTKLSARLNKIIKSFSNTSVKVAQTLVAEEQSALERDDRPNFYAVIEELAEDIRAGKVTPAVIKRALHTHGSNPQAAKPAMKTEHFVLSYQGKKPKIEFSKEAAKAIEANQKKFAKGLEALLKSCQ
ncbi:ParB/RepB/Spo0J family partition protein [Sinobacterium caligoides]|nr:ParB/RepB/Spo0J family partition protein [Sinobacterium caligoides]